MIKDNTKELFAYFGRAVYLAQVVEKGIMSIIILSRHEVGITKFRHDELLSKLSSLTFGQIKRKLYELNIFNPEELKLIDEFHDKRDFLIHSFWWERAVELYDKMHHNKLFLELEELAEFFEEVDSKISLKHNESEFAKGIDLNDSIKDLVSYGKTPSGIQCRELSKNEVVTDIFGYKNAPNSIIPIFELEDKSFWTICENGLSQHMFEIIERNKVSIPQLVGIFPIKQFNPNPKINRLWDYHLDLKKKGLKMKISKNDRYSPIKWSLI